MKQGDQSDHLVPLKIKIVFLTERINFFDETVFFTIQLASSAICEQ